jgi:hypothetical protein
MGTITTALEEEMKQRIKSVLFFSVVFAVLTGAALAKTPSPSGSELYFINPQDGDSVSSPITVRFGLKGMGVAPAGIEKAKTGHHHLLIDTDPPVLSQPIPKDAQHKHFGGGQTETVIELSPGTHTLQLLLGDHNHFPHDPPVKSKQISITVEK